MSQQVMPNGVSNQENQQSYDNVGAIPSQQDVLSDSLLNQHLNANEMLNTLKKMLIGYEYNDDLDEWVVSKRKIQDEYGNIIEVEEGPLMDPKDIRITIAYLQMFLNSNTYLSRVKEERINDIMWDISVKLASLFYRLRHKLSPETRDMIWGMIEYPILMGLSRASDKITLDALSKMQHTIEHVGGNQPNQKDDKFKLFGF